MIRLRALLVVGLLTTLAGRATAEAVRLRVEGRDAEEGQGWLFRDAASGFCGVVTAAHVAAPDGRPGRVTIVSAGGGEGIGEDVRILSPEPDRSGGEGLDIALMRVEGSIRERGCTTATLGSRDLDQVLRRSQRGRVEQVTVGGETVWQEVEFLTRNNEDPRRVSFRPRNPKDEVTQGYSGGPVVEADEQRANSRALPLALIVRVDPEYGAAEAVRFDAVSALVRADIRARSAPPPAPSAAPGRALAPRPPAASAVPASGPRIVGWDGETADLSCPGPNAANGEPACGWRARPLGKKNSIAVVVAPSNATSSHVGVRLGADDGPPVRVTVEASQTAGSDDWVWLKTATLAGGTGSLDFLPVQATRLRVSVGAQTGQVTEVRITDLR